MRKLIPIKHYGDTHIQKVQYPPHKNVNTPIDENVKDNKYNNKLHRIIDKFHETIDRFIHWICKKFDMGAEDNLIRDFEKENYILLNAEKQVKRENKEKELDLER